MTQAAPSGGGGGDGSSYNIKPNSVSPAGEEQSMGYQEIMQNLHNLKPGDVASAGDAFKNLGTVLDNIASDLATTGNQLSQHWQGTAAQAAMTKFQQLHDQAAQLAAQAHTTANVASWVGNDVLPQYKNIPDPQVMSKSESDAVIGGAVGGVPGAAVGSMLGAFGIGSDGSAKADQAARGYLASLNGHLATANTSLPNTVSGPPGSFGGSGTMQGSTAHTGSGAGSGYGGSGYGGVGGSGGTGPGPGGQNYPTPGGTGHLTPVKLPTGGPGPTGTLQGYNPPPGGGSVPPFGSGPPGGVTTGGGSANPFSRMAMMPGGGPGAGGGGEGLPGEGGLGEGSGLAGESGLANGADTGSVAAGEGAAADAAGAEAAGVAGAEGAEGMGMTGMPMGGSGSGQQDKERQRQAWMHEDEDIWGVPKQDIGPVLG